MAFRYACVFSSQKLTRAACLCFLLAAPIALTARADEEASKIIPHVEANGEITWIATIDAATVSKFKEEGNKSEDHGEGHMLALERWLTERLKRAPWCNTGWGYRGDIPKYIEELPDGELRVLGRCQRYQSGAK